MNDEEFQRLLNADPPLVIEFGLGAVKFVAWLILILTFVVSLAVFLSAKKELWFSITFALILTGIESFFLWRGGFYPYIMDRQNFTIQNVLRGQYIIQWKDVSKLELGKPVNMRGFTARSLIVHFKSAHRPIKLNALGSGSLSIPQLKQLMNHWRERALQQNG
jgi:hypothetical protein